jgi:Fic family protein
MELSETTAARLPALGGTPYLVDGEASSLKRFAKVQEKSEGAKTRALQVAERVARDAGAIFESFRDAIRSDLVAESNQMEGYAWTQQQVRETVSVHKELLNAPVHHLLTSLRDDPRVMEALGLYRAHQLADEWALGSQRPREYEIRSLHSLILAGHRTAGRYKEGENAISGAAHVPVSPTDTPIQMAAMANWWQAGTGDAVLDASVVHAWLTHIHPFDDGNGRMARLLANLALVQQSYPPLLIRTESDRGQYYDALAASDGGDILPLYELFVSILRRSVRVMSKPDYVQAVIEDRLLSSQRQRHELWSEVIMMFERHLGEAAAKRALSISPQGRPDLSSFSLLEEYDADGNCWFTKVLDPSGVSKWLMWFGFNSTEMRELSDSKAAYPSIFFSYRTESDTAIHPYEPRWRSGSSDLPTELVLLPGRVKPVVARWDQECEDLTLQHAAELTVEAITREI